MVLLQLRIQPLLKIFPLVFKGQRQSLDLPSRLIRYRDQCKLQVDKLQSCHSWVYQRQIHRQGHVFSDPNASDA